MLMHPIQALRKHSRRDVLGHSYFTWDGVKNLGGNAYVIIECSHRVNVSQGFTFKFYYSINANPSVYLLGSFDRLH